MKKLLLLLALLLPLNASAACLSSTVSIVGTNTNALVGCTITASGTGYPVTSNSSSSAGFSMGDGTNADNLGFSFSGGRFMGGYDATRNNGVLNAGTSKGIDLYYGGTSGTLKSGTIGFTLSSGGSVTIGSPTGGAEGVGTINVAGTIYANGTALGTASTANTGASGATVPLLNGTNTWSNAQTFNAGITSTSGAFTKSLSGGQQTPAIGGSSFAIDASQANFFHILLVHASCPCTVNSPTNPTDGQKLIYEIQQSATGSDTIGTWGVSFDFGASGTPTLTTTASAIDLVGFVYSATNSKWMYLGSQLGN